MTLKAVEQATSGAAASRVRGYWRQALMVVLINVPAVSFGLAVGWVSLASGQAGGDGVDDAQAVVAAGTTYLASLAGVPLCARALAAGRKPAVIATSAAFVACWCLKLCGGGWWVVAARACAGVGGAGAWCLAPLLAREMCEAAARGAAVAALVVAHNLGLLLMYLAADARLAHSVVVWSCLALSAVHCAVFLLVPESPAFLAAAGRHDEARAALAWLRGLRPDAAALQHELRALPAPDQPLASLYSLTKRFLSERGRRRTFWLVLAAVVGQEACGVLALLQYAERVFLLADPRASPARLALLLGAAQLLASVLALYLVEKLGRKKLMVWCGVATSACLCGGAGALWGGATGWWAGGALAGAVFADSAGLQPAPYAMLADAFEYEFHGCAVLLVSVAACAANVADVVVFPLVARGAGLAAALALAAALTLALAGFAALALPETRARSPREIYAAVCPPRAALQSVASSACTKL